MTPPFTARPTMLVLVVYDLVAFARLGPFFEHKPEFFRFIVVAATQDANLLRLLEALAQRPPAPYKGHSRLREVVLDYSGEIFRGHGCDV